MTLRWSLSSSMRLIDALQERLGEKHSARSLKRALSSNVCLVNGKVERFASVHLEKGAKIEFSWQGEEKVCSFLPVILYENEDVVIINKPAGLICLNSEMSKALKRPLFLAHRLDKDTTGVLLLATSFEVSLQLQERFRERAVEKTYLALVDGVPKKTQGDIVSRFVKKRVFQGQTIWGSTSFPEEKGLLAETSWRTIRSFEDASLLECCPHTGRTHQIRVHLAEMGHPILIDRQYASKFRSKLPAKRTLLHAKHLRLIWQGLIMDVEAPLPPDLCEYFNR